MENKKQRTVFAGGSGALDLGFMYYASKNECKTERLSNIGGWSGEAVGAPTELLCKVGYQ